MGFWNSIVNFIKGDDEQLLLEEGKIKEKENNDTNELNIDGHIINGNVEMSVIIDGREVVLGEWEANPNRHTHPIDKIKEVRQAFGMLKYASQGEIQDAKQNIISILNDIAYNDATFYLNESCINIINNYNLNTMDYELLNKLPTTIDWDSMPVEQKMLIGRQAQNRLYSLGKIRDIEDAQNDKENLVNYMQLHENVPTNPLVDANIQSVANGIKLDDETLKQIAKNMEPIPNEDGALYSVYLRLEEKRIWKQLQTRILEYAKVAEDKEAATEVYRLSDEIRQLEGYNLHTTSEEFSYDVLTYIVNELKELNIENYITNIKEKDFELAQKINTKCPEIQDKTDILQFLYARIGSLGQLSYKSSITSTDMLREFVVKTDFKHEDAKESHEFLLLVARIEEEHIRSKCAKAIELYNGRIGQDLTLKEKIGVGFTPTVNLDNKANEDLQHQNNKSDWQL